MYCFVTFFVYIPTQVAASQGVRVNCICPSLVDTPLVHSSPILKAAIEQLGLLE